MSRLVTLTGLAAAAVYVATVTIGGWLTPGYSHLQQPVSALFELGAPHALPVSLAFIVYNLLLIGFGVGLLRLLPLPANMILANGVLGLVIEVFPMDPPGAALSTSGIIHMGLAGGLVLTCILAMAIAATLWWRDPRHHRLVPVTIALLVVMIVGGGLAAQAATGGWPLLGLFQRATIGAYLAWVMIVALGFRRTRA